MQGPSMRISFKLHELVPKFQVTRPFDIEIKRPINCRTFAKHVGLQL